MNDFFKFKIEQKPYLKKNQSIYRTSESFQRRINPLQGFLVIYYSRWASPIVNRFNPFRVFLTIKNQFK